MRDKLLTDAELSDKLKECITLIDEIFNRDCIRTALFVYQVDEATDEIYTPVKKLLIVPHLSRF